MSDAKIRTMLGMSADAPVLEPELLKSRLDLSRCRTYAVNKADEAIGMYRAEYHVEPDFCIAAPIGGRTKVTGWTIGLIPINEEQAHADECERTTTASDDGTRESIPAGDE